jgi:hypothetical protein
MGENPLKNFRHFDGITEAWELQRTGLVVVNDTRYKLELWHSYANPDIPYYVHIFELMNGVWTKLPDAPFSEGLEADIALSTAMSFLSEKAAA